MRDHMRQTETDTIDVVTFLKKQDIDKDTEVNNDYLHQRKKTNNISDLLIDRSFTTKC